MVGNQTAWIESRLLQQIREALRARRFTLRQLLDAIDLTEEKFRQVVRRDSAEPQEIVERVVFDIAGFLEVPAEWLWGRMSLEQATLANIDFLENRELLHPEEKQRLFQFHAKTGRVPVSSFELHRQLRRLRADQLVMSACWNCHRPVLEMWGPRCLCGKYWDTPSS